MTREAIIAELYAVKRVCRGTPIFDQATRDSLTAQASRCVTTADRSALIARMTSILGSSPVHADADIHTIQSVIYGYQNNCGQNFNDVISTYPFNGQSWDVTCPNCGNPQHFQSPLMG